MGGCSLIPVLYVVGPGERNEAFRYSLRSIDRYMPGVEVFVAGYRPSWVRGVTHVPVVQQQRSWANVARVLYAACVDERTPEEFLLLNDDFFALSEVMGVPPLVHTGPLEELGEFRGWSGGWYGDALVNTMGLLSRWGVESALSYDRVHQPLPVRRDVMRGVLSDSVSVRPVLHRSLYGNVVGGGVRGVDVKVRFRDGVLPGGGWVSTAPGAWCGLAGGVVRGMFPDPCRYEQ